MTLIAWFFSLFSVVGNAQIVLPVVADFVAPTSQSRLDRHVLGKIRKDGWYPLHVAAQGQAPGFSYSLGFYANNAQPEVVVDACRVAHAPS